MSEKPVVFVGSSREGLEVARVIQAQLSDEAEVELWYDGSMFELGSTTLESLVNALDEYDFAVLIMSADDLLESRGVEQRAARDNILLEIGLFMGKLGRERTFVVYQKDANLKIPSDLAGMTTATFAKPTSDDKLTAALGPACTKIRNAIKKQGTLVRLEKVEAHQNILDSQIRALQIIVKGIVTEFEFQKLEGLAGSGPFWVKYRRNDMYEELKRLDAIRYIQPQPGYGITSIHEHADDLADFDLKQYIRITEEGLEYLKLREAMRSSSG